MVIAEVIKQDSQHYLQSNNRVSLAPDNSSPSIAYFCMEYCVDSTLPIYSGGLGVLAGDHLKAASDLNIPLVGVGLFYHHGYFRQRIREDGWQIEEYPLVDPQAAGLKTLSDDNDQPLAVKVPIEDRSVSVQAYLKQVGSTPLILLTTNLTENTEEDRLITAHLYGARYKGDNQTRIRQEIVLGIGGKKMLDKLGFRIGAYHMNEGHSAFLIIARLAVLVEKGLSEDEALEQIRSNQLFTNHTLVPAGNDIFPNHVVEKEFVSYASLFQNGIQRHAVAVDQAPDCWSQARFAMACATETTAVSRIHSEAAATKWYKDKVAYVTNGVHHSWMDDEMRTLIDPNLTRFIRKHTDPDYLNTKIEIIDPEEFQYLRRRKRQRLTEFSNEYASTTLFDPDILTIGFARRAATYKRLDLLFRDPDRLLAIIKDQARPVQIVLAAKAHPQDDDGKQTIQRLVQLTRDPQFRQHTLFIPDYDSHIAKHMVVGADVWLNVPKKYEEASGTSGMKNGINGGRQWSIDDGWMNEVPEKHYFKINDDPNPDVVAATMYQMLQGIITPQFYGQDRSWAQDAIASMGYTIQNFSASRMVTEYNEKFYEQLMTP